MQITKRNQTTQSFDPTKIENALFKCFHQVGRKNALELAKTLTYKVCLSIKNNGSTTVERIQDQVEKLLLNSNELTAYEEYARYRKEREIIRNLKSKISNEVKQAFAESKKYFPNILSEIQFYDKMARYNHEKKRRETWKEMIQERVMPCLRHFSDNKLSEKVYSLLEENILATKATPSFRLLAMAGEAAIRDNTCIYNCSFLVPDNLRFFAEDLYISMCGTGDGFSVEDYYISQLPFVKHQTGEVVHYVFEDNTESWCDGWVFNIINLIEGKDVTNDTSKIRKEGSILKVKGGRSSGPKPLINSLKIVRDIILNAQGRNLFSDENADIVCVGGDCAIAGGMRRTAKICICDFGDPRMRAFKNPENTKDKPWRYNTNVSEAFARIYTQEEIDDFVDNMHNSGRGENGIFSRINAVLNAPERRIKYWEKILGYEIGIHNAYIVSLILKIGTNPCGEIFLRTFCNLSIAVARAGDVFKTLSEKVKVAAILGTIQSCATYFPYLNKEWERISKEERLLGVDIIGQADIGFLPLEWQAKLKQVVIDTNIEFANILGIEQSMATTCVKPGGNSGTFLQASSSISKHKHEYSLRNIEVNIFTPIFKVLKHSKVPGFPKPGYEHNTYIFSIPQKAPDGALIQENDTLAEQLDYWLQIKQNYTEHNPSCTLYYALDELPYLKKWIFEHQHVIGGLTFFPKVDWKFDYLPIEKISKEEYEQRVADLPEIDWELLAVFETDDQTTASKEFACAGDNCSWG
jgi:ribonucleoside-diphosphate reductase alpha chain